MLEGFAAVLLVLGSVLVLWTVLRADRAEEAGGAPRSSPEQPVHRTLGRAA
jgi:hypothetical protein